jgi:hypothetical protein
MKSFIAEAQRRGEKLGLEFNCLKSLILTLSSLRQENKVAPPYFAC